MPDIVFTIAGVQYPIPASAYIRQVGALGFSGDRPCPDPRTQRAGWAPTRREQGEGRRGELGAEHGCAPGSPGQDCGHRIPDPLAKPNPPVKGGSLRPG